MMNLLKQSTARNASVFMTQSADHVTGLAGATLTINASADGGAFSPITPVVTDLTNGWYSLALTTTHTQTLGDLVLHITATSADPTDLLMQVVLDLPGATVSSVTGAVGSVTGAVGSVTGAVGSVTGAVGSVTGNVEGNIVGTVASVVGNIGGNVVGTVASVVGNIGGNVVGTVASVVGNVGGNVVGTVASVVGNVGGNVVGSVASVVAVVSANLTQILGTALTETSGQIAAAFKKFFNIASPTSTMNQITLVDTVTTYTGNTPQTGDSFARLGAPAGASVSADVAAVNAKTTNLPASPAAVGSAMTLTSGERTSIATVVWNSLTSGMGTAGSIGLLLKTNIDVVLSVIYDEVVAIANFVANQGATINGIFSDTQAIRPKTNNLPSDPASNTFITGVANALAGLIQAVPTNPLLTNDSRLDNLDAPISGVVTLLGTPTSAATIAGDLELIYATLSQDFPGSIIDILATIDNDVSNCSDQIGGLATGGFRRFNIFYDTDFPGYLFYMYDAQGNPLTGLSPLAQISVDGSTFVNCTNQPTEVGLGLYTIDLAGAQIGFGHSVGLQFSATGAVTQNIVEYTVSV